MGNLPKPTALKILQGTDRKDRANQAEPKPDLGASPPPFLPRRGPAWAAWKRHSAVLTKLRVLTEADADVLALGCMALAEYLEARGSDDNWRRAESAWKRYGAALGWFGLNPSGRAKVQTVSPGTLDPLDEWLAR